MGSAARAPSAGSASRKISRSCERPPPSCVDSGRIPSDFYARSIERATDELQLLEAARTNRQKRERLGRFIVEGVRNIDAALRSAWPLHQVLVPTGHPPSSWAQRVAGTAGVEVVGLAPDLFDRLTDREERPELLLVAKIPVRTLDDIQADDHLVVVVLDRIASPGNLGTIVRTADAFGAGAVVTVGHSASPWDPQTVRASTGSLFGLPVIAVDGPDALGAFCRARGLAIVATDEHGDVDIAAADLRRPCALLLGNETSGLSRALRELADLSVRIPIGGTASSLNVAVAAGIALHELARRAAP